MQAMGNIKIAMRALNKQDMMLEIFTNSYQDQWVVSQQIYSYLEDQWVQVVLV